LLLNYSMHSVLSAINSGICAGPIALAKRLASALPQRPRLGSVVEMGSAIFHNRKFDCVLKIGIVVVVLGIMSVTWTFYHTFRLVCDVMALLSVCFAAVDSANIVFKNSKDFYVKRLSFWVLLQIWNTLSLVPIMGAGLSLASPIAFSLFFLGGDHLLQWLLIPVAVTLESFPKAVTSTLASGLCSSPWSRAPGGKNEIDGKPEWPPGSSCTPRHVFQETLFNMFVAPVANLPCISNVRAVWALKALLSDTSAS